MKLTVIRGTNGCGKTTFAAAVAGELAREGVSTLLISPDPYIPTFGVWMPLGNPTESLGEVLAAKVEAVRLAGRITIMPGLSNLGLLGFEMREPSDKYIPANREAAKNLLETAGQLGAQLLIDATAPEEAVSWEAIRQADLQIRLTETDPRGLLHLRSLPPEKSKARTLWFSCARSSDDAVSEFSQILGLDFVRSIPFLEEAHTKLREGRLFEPYSNRDYRAAVETAVKAVRRG